MHNDDDDDEVKHGDEDEDEHVCSFCIVLQTETHNPSNDHDDTATIVPWMKERLSQIYQEHSFHCMGLLSFQVIPHEDGNGGIHGHGHGHGHGASSCLQSTCDTCAWKKMIHF
jgi:hypothetical protein